MKKIIFTLALLMTTAICWADAKVESGSLLELKDPNARVLITWDYSKQKVEGKSIEEYLQEKGPDWERDYPAELAAGEAAFDVQFNKKDKKYALITDDEDSAQFEMVIHVDEFNYGSTGAAIAFGGFARGASIEGTAEVIRLSDKAVIATIKFDCAGAAAYSAQTRRVAAYIDLAGDLAKLVGKAK